ncbi:MAG: polysaccharide deacetylase family protein [Gammaproteobacteria bacterium]|nr:polysaccharide deacetylase family protein [Gammaproteobacteria bacterium]
MASLIGRHRWPFLKGQLLILGYHRILPSNHPEYKKMQPGMRVEPEILKMHIQTLKKYFEVVDLNEWVERVKAGKPVPKKACSLTFDDGWVDNYEYAFPVLKKENVPATIFLVSSMIGTTQNFWPERVTDILIQLKEKQFSEVGEEQQKWLTDFGLTETEMSHLDESMIDEFINQLKVLPDEKIYKILDGFDENQNIDLAATVNEPTHILNALQIKEMMSSGLVSFASHTQQHLRLTMIESEKNLEHEIAQSKTVLENMLENKITGFCYPNGDFDDRSVSLVKTTYDYACTTRKGWNSSKSDAFLLNRMLVHNDVSNTPVKFESRISNLL